MLIISGIIAGIVFTGCVWPVSEAEEDNSINYKSIFIEKLNAHWKLQIPELQDGSDTKIKELANGSFQPVIDDATAQPEKVEKLVFCSGKLYYELLAKKEELNDDKVALVRIEQLYPLNPEIIQGIFDKYSNRKEFVWAQEEPENMGAWTYMLRNFRNENIQVIAPVASGTPAPGTHKKFEKNQKGVINRVFGVAEENVDLVRPITTVND
jgi:2-oxoglutarate dehydrogenase E1 component